MKILLTGFEAFGTVEENPTQVMVEQMAHNNNLSDEIELVCEILPVDYGVTGKRIRELMDVHQPDAVVMMGVAASRKEINLEYVAANCDTSASPDNSGNKRSNRVIDPRFDYYFKRPSTLPLDYLFYELRINGIPAIRSYDAGGYLCNHVFYHAMTHALEDYDKPIKAGFIHVPLFDAIDKDTQIEAIHKILHVVSDPKIDRKQQCHPLIQSKFDEVFEKLPDDPSWCSLVSRDGLLVAHSGQPDDEEAITAYTTSTEVLGDRLMSDLAHDDFGFCIWGNKSALFLVADLQIVPHLLIIKWADGGSLSSVHLTSQILPKLMKPLAELLN